MSTPTLTKIFQNTADAIRDVSLNPKTKKSEICPLDFPSYIYDAVKENFGQILFDDSMDMSSILTAVVSGTQAPWMVLEIHGGTFLDHSPISNFSNLVTVRGIKTSGITNFANYFAGDTSLETIDVFDTSDATNMTNMFDGCEKLSDLAIDNILQMCINALSYNGTKTLAELGLYTTNSSDYYKQCAQDSDYYQEFLDAGWTIGF